MKVIGLDCSTNRLAWATFDDDTLIKFGEINYGRGDIWHRANNAQTVVRNLMDMNLFEDVDVVGVEAAVYINNRKTVIDLATLYGAAVSPLARPGVKVVSVSPIAWQSFIGNKTFTRQEKLQVEKDYPGKTKSWYKDKIRQMRKQRTMEWAYKEFGVIDVSDDVADAVGVAFFTKEKHGK